MTTNADRKRTRIDFTALSLRWHLDWSVWVFGVRVDWSQWMRYLIVEFGPVSATLEVEEDLVDDQR